MRAKDLKSGSSGRYVSGVEGTPETLDGASGRSRRNMRKQLGVRGTAGKRKKLQARPLGDIMGEKPCTFL